MFSGDQLERYSRHFVLREIGVEGQKHLINARVLVIGAGALGSAALMYLAGAGVGTLGIADGDRVSLSNLQRQILHRTSDVGLEKTVSAAHTLAALNPDVNLELHSTWADPDNIRKMITAYDFIVDATDRFESKFLINDACVLEKKPFVHAGAVRFGGQIMTYVPANGPCLRCLLGSVPPPESSPSCAQAGILGAATGVLGSLEALETVKYLLGFGDLLTGRVLEFDGLSMRMRTVSIPEADPDCAVCSQHPRIKDLICNRSEYELSEC